ncbi:MAG: HD domain-containing phosphohydrolase [Coriobacteriia bacterium]|nr:HD domain-containing phosphohydrolase [Coriobacteriia bacterium]
MNSDVSRLLKREFQLNLIAYAIIISLIASVAVLVFMALAGIKPPDIWLMRNDIFRTLATGFLLMVILYLVDQHRRLRTELLGAHEELERARIDIEGAYDRLAFSHHAAEVMTSLAQEDGLKVVLAESVRHFNADAAAVVGDDITITTAENIDARQAQSAVLQVALEAVRAGKPLSTATNDQGSTAIAVPLRIRGQLKSVVALWRHENDFTVNELEGLGLVARIIELGMENRLLLEEVKVQLSGTLRAMVDLVEQRRPNYIPHSTRVAEYSVAVAKIMGLREDETNDVRLAAMLQDVGMLEVPEAILNAPRRLTSEELLEVQAHAKKGANLAKIANFDPIVQDAILCHHERLDGSGYPRGLKGDDIPLAAKILAVTDSYVAMTSDRPHRPRMSAINALNELRAGAGRMFDARVVREFIRVQAEALAEDASPVAAGAHALSRDPVAIRRLA